MIDTTQKVKNSLKKRYLKEKIFKASGFISIAIAFLFLIVLLSDITIKALPAFIQTQIELEIDLNPEELGLTRTSSADEIKSADFRKTIRDALKKQFPKLNGRKNKKDLYSLVSIGAEYQLRDIVMENPQLIGTKLSVKLYADDDVDSLIKGTIERNVPESERRIKDYKLSLIETLESNNQISKNFNWTFFTGGDSREPELAGIKGAVMGSIYTILITLMLSFPVAVAAAIYLEEFAPKNRFIDFVEININNLAAVPSIVFGLLGLAVFINFFSLCPL